MSNTRYNVTAPRKYMSNGEEKTQWQRVGTAFVNDKGGFDITLDVQPLPEQDRKIDGQLTIRLKAFPADQDGGGARRAAAPAAPAGDDDIPF